MHSADQTAFLDTDSLLLIHLVLVELPYFLSEVPALKQSDSGDDLHDNVFSEASDLINCLHVLVYLFLL